LFFLGHFPHAFRFVVVVAPHWVAGDRNDRFTDAVLAFLSRARNGGR
jgi:hypothetical protein